MSGLDDDEIMVTLPAEDGAAVITKVEGGKKTVPDDPIQDLKSQFDTLKGTLSQTTQRLVGAERQLVDQGQELAAARKEVTSSQLDTVLTGLQAAESEATAAEQAYITAAEAGDYSAQARAQRRIGAAEAKIARLKEAEGDLKDQAVAKPARQEARQQDPVEQFTAGMSEKSAAWVRAHSDCVTNPKQTARMMAAHNLAIADDIPVDSDEYFSRIEAGIATKQGQQERPVNIRPSAPVAPNSAAGGGMNGGERSVRLSPGEVTAANDGTIPWNHDDPKGRFKKGDPIGTTEFARRKLAMTKEGHYDRSRDLQ